jgi:hypothetical protein
MHSLPGCYSSLSLVNPVILTTPGRKQVFKAYASMSGDAPDLGFYLLWSGALVGEAC